MKKFRILIFVALIVGVFAALTGATLLDAHSKGNASSGPVVMTGTWTQTSGISDITMTATITNDRIDVKMDTGDTSGDYWVGSFKSSNRSTSFTVQSTADTSAMEFDILASQDANKTFTYNDGDLSFPMSIMGVSTIVHMTRS